ncbi:LacI family transcriptional regulator [Sphingobacteriaceae bacterium GW460-11-11-14-LB5]|nr:LacI family transcriptional regulator [Sphingobacteriaceae bacterium GW460-11-11-14-LB5]
MKSKPATLKEIADLLGLSISTVSRSLIDHPTISLVTRERVKKLAKKVNYRPNHSALSFRSGRTFTIGLILPDLSETFFSTAMTAIEEMAMANNYAVFVAQSMNSEEQEIALVEKMIDFRVDGLLIALAKETQTFGHFSRLKDNGIPVVFFDRVPPYFSINSVCCNIELATQQAVDFLLKKGHRRIGMINGPESLLSSTERKNGYIKALEREQISFDPSLYTECDLTESGTEKEMDRLLAVPGRPSAVLAFNDYVAIYAIRKLRAQHITAAEAIDFVSFSNLSVLRFMDYRPIATVEQSPALQGKTAMQILMDLVNSRYNGSVSEQRFRNVVLEGKLVLDQ